MPIGCSVCENRTNHEIIFISQIKCGKHGVLWMFQLPDIIAQHLLINRIGIDTYLFIRHRKHHHTGIDYVDCASQTKSYEFIAMSRWS